MVSESSFGVFNFRVKSEEWRYEMDTKRMDPKKQFSKRLARWTAVFWFAYIIGLAAVITIEPAVAQYAFFMSIVVSVIMLINIYSYQKNSLTEKALLTLLDKTRLELTLSNKKTKGFNVNEGNDLTEEEGESNG